MLQSSGNIVRFCTAHGWLPVVAKERHLCRAQCKIEELEIFPLVLQLLRFRVHQYAQLPLPFQYDLRGFRPMRLRDLGQSRVS